MEYQHGGDIYTNCVTMDFSANINPKGIPKSVKEAMYHAVDQAFCYPDSECRLLREDLSRFHNIPMEQILCANGAADLIFQVAWALRPRQALLIAPSFLEYEQALRSVSCHITYYDLKEEQGFVLHEDALIQWLEQQPVAFDILFLCNPNNPTGFVLEQKQLNSILDYCRKKGIFCVVDECFNEFLDEPWRYSVLERLRQKESGGVFVLKAFTKIYAMAGVRLGYGICGDSQVLHGIQKIRQPWSVSGIAQAAGVAALKENRYVEESRVLIAREREFLKGRLMTLGFHVFDSKANYIFFKDTRTIAEKREKLLYYEMLERKVLIRSCGNYRGLDGTYYRICVKQRKENEEFLSVLESLWKEGDITCG